MSENKENRVWKYICVPCCIVSKRLKQIFYKLFKVECFSIICIKQIDTVCVMSTFGHLTYESLDFLVVKTRFGSYNLSVLMCL